MTFATFILRLETALQRPLPGVRAQRRLAPRPDREWPQGFDRAHARDAAGLLLVFPRERRPHIVLTVRADNLGRHGGQVSLPGGVVEPGETHEEAARREAHEEIGISPRLVRILGALTPVDIVASGFRLHPILAWAKEPPRLRPREGEVARILELPIDDLLAPSRIAWRSRVRETTTIHYPAFVIDGVEIWGATAMVLAEMLVLAGWSGPAAY